MNPIEKVLKDFPLIILDGGLATELERRGCNINDTLWSAKILVENPLLIEKVHYDYLASGADCIITSSYQATIDGFIEKGFTKTESVALIQKSVRIAKKAREDFWKSPMNRENRPYPLIAGSAGPYGAYLANGSEYRGDYKLSEQKLMDFHRSRVKLLAEEYVDILAFETIPNFTEAKAIAKLLKEFPDFYCYISFSAKNNLQISDGTLISKCAEYLNKFHQVAAIGVNCTSPKYIPSLIYEIKKNTNKPIVVYPNSGEEYDAQNKNWHGVSSSEAYSSAAKEWFEKGARLIGGCCRTTPEHIKAIEDWARTK